MKNIKQKPKGAGIMMLGAVLIALFLAWRGGAKGWMALGYAALGLFVGCVGYAALFPEKATYMQ